MNTVSHLADAIYNNLFLALAAGLLVIKFVIAQCARRKGESLRLFVALPEEMAYIALSFVLAGLVGTMGGFDHYWLRRGTQHPKMADGVLLAICTLVCVVIHILTENGVESFLQKSAASLQLTLKSKTHQHQDDDGPSPFAWPLFQYSLLGAIFYFIAFGIAMLWLWQVSRFILG